MNTTISLSREQVENIVRRSYQYVAMFNVNEKFALDPASGGMFMDGFNKPIAMTQLVDATAKSIARPIMTRYIRGPCSTSAMIR
jgi:hypothetical protein